MKIIKSVTVFSFFIVLLGCLRARNNRVYVDTSKLSNQLFVERYEDSISDFSIGVNPDYYYYLTDSNNFREFVGEHGEDEFVEILKRDNTIIIYKGNRATKNKSWEYTDSIKHKLSELIKHGIFDD